MAAAQEIEPRHTVRAASLFGVLVLAKALALSGRDLPFSGWAPFAFLWQDVLSAAAFLALDVFLTNSALAWLVYGIAVSYVAINVPVSTVLGTPLTWTMIRAVGGPLSDSIRHYVTAFNVGCVVLVLAAGILLPVLLARRWPFRLPQSLFGVALLTVVAGVTAESRIETRGLHRNAFGALAASTVARVRFSGALTERSEFNTGPSPDPVETLEQLRGTAKGRNVILIVLESTAARYLGLYGAARDPTPRLTELGRQSALVFESAYAVYPESIKGLFATICSRYPAFNTPAEVHARTPCVSLASKLGDAGYRSALFHSGRFKYLGMAPMIADRGFELLEDAGAIGGNTQSSFGVDEPATVQRMLGWIDSLEKDERFFLMYLPVAGHHPYAVQDEGPFEGTSEFDRYLNSLHDGDAALGTFLEGLRARQLDERTLFVVQGDHGEAFGQHPENFAHSLFIYDENIRVPFVIAAPGLLPGQVRVKRVASAIDTAPTVLDLLGQTIAPDYQGASLLEPEARPAFFFTDYSLGWLGLRDSCWKYLYEVDSGRSKLFDVCNDPDETRDLSGNFEARVRAYRDRVQTWAAAQAAAIGRGR